TAPAKRKESRCADVVKRERETKRGRDAETPPKLPLSALSRRHRVIIAGEQRKREEERQEEEDEGLPLFRRRWHRSKKMPSSSILHAREKTRRCGG
ncbi:hypothetical protein PIB30_100065, partial [Stylosanthes scabra]|nr:hypothetical protein [Stylosanthes scabra]